MKRALLLLLTALPLSRHASAEWWAPESQTIPTPQGDWIDPGHGLRIRIQPAQLAATLAAAPAEGARARNRAPTLVDLPMPDGSVLPFRVEESPVMEPGLAAQLPDVRTYSAVCVDDPAITARLDLTPAGFHAIILTPDDAIYIDPAARGDTARHSVYSRKTHLALNPEKAARSGCRGTRHRDEPDSPVARRIAARPAADSPDAAAAAAPMAADAPTPSAAPVPVTLRTYRIAMMADGDFTTYHGGAAAALAAIVTGVNRLNAIYERDLAVRFTLVANNNLLVFTTASDPTVGATTFTPLINARIGSGAYDIGHLLMGSNFGGLAQLEVVCNATYKAEGQTGSDEPNNDPFWVDLVSHEIGHQFGADHTFNATTDSCGDGNRNATTAYEPGSGSTIMAYAGICAPNDVQNFSDPYFHAISLQQMTSFILAGGTCAATSAPGNQTPEVNAGLDRTIPARTPFTLTATATDGDGDPLTYCWEQWDLGAANSLTSSDTGVGPLFRSLPPSFSPSRTLPKLSSLLANTTSNLEKLPTLARTMRFRCTVRDNHPGGGGTAVDEVVLNVVGTAGPFRVTAPNTAVTRSGSTTITWDVANTTASPILCSSVNILLSTDGGNTWPTLLRLGTPNDGTETVTLPNINSTTARIRVEAVDNIFFDVSDVNFTVLPGGGSGAPVFGNPGGATIADTLGNGNGNGRADPGETALELVLPVRNIGTGPASGVTATLAAVTAGVIISQASSTYSDLPVDTTGVNTDTFLVGVPGSHPCGSPFTVRLTVRSTQATNVVDYTFTTGAPAAPISYTFTGATAIPDDQPLGVSIPIQVSSASGMSGAITDVDFSFDGTNCSINSGTGLQHAYVSDLTVTLISPTGTEVILMEEIGLANVAQGPNFCGTVLDDAAAGGSIQDVGDFAGPYTGTFTPYQSLSAFNGLPAIGTWTLKIVDNFAPDSGTVRGFTLRITGTTTCTAPDSTPPSANLALSAVTSPSSVSTSSVTRTTFTLNNLGPDPSQDAVLTVPMPAGVQSASFSPAGTQQGSNLIFNLGNLALNASRTVTIDWNLGLATPGAQSRTATVSATTADPVSGNNSALVQFTVADLDLDTIPDFNDPDVDGDSIPNDWELAFFGGSTNAPASADGDMDGFTNLQEYIAMTDPADPDDFFEIRQAAAQGGGFVLQVPSDPARRYRLRATPGLVSPVWTDLQTNVPGGVGVLQFTDPAPGPDFRVYQVDVRLPTP